MDGIFWACFLAQGSSVLDMAKDFSTPHGLFSLFALVWAAFVFVFYATLYHLSGERGVHMVLLGQEDLIPSPA
jgi:hypothetical protein